MLTIIFKFIFHFYASYILEKYSDFVEIKKYKIFQIYATITFMDSCKHVYEEVGEELCPDCGKNTHKVDWQYQADLHKEWIASGKAVYNGWWSI